MLMARASPIYEYYYSGNTKLKFPSYRAVDAYLRTLTCSHFVDSFHPYYGWSIIRRNLRTGKKVIFEFNPQNYYQSHE